MTKNNTKENNVQIIKNRKKKKIKNYTFHKKSNNDYGKSSLPLLSSSIISTSLYLSRFKPQQYKLFQ